MRRSVAMRTLLIASVAIVIGCNGGGLRPGDGCDTDDDCDGGDVCSLGECVECERDGDCDDDETCNDAGDCVPLAGEGEGEGDAGEGEGEGEGDGGDAPRFPCSNSFGNALSVGPGRLDGTLVSVVMPGANGCRGDDNHVHLQVRMGSPVYDVVINVESEFATDSRVGIATLPLDGLPGTPFSEGWHAFETVDYVFDFGLSANQFTLLDIDALAARIDDEVSAAGRISVYMDAFDATGGHRVHRNGGGAVDDGLLIVDPTGASPIAIAFRFSDQNF